MNKAEQLILLEAKAKSLNIKFDDIEFICTHDDSHVKIKVNNSGTNTNELLNYQNEINN